MQDRDTKVIGYFAYITGVSVICVDTDACLIADSEAAMKAHITRHAQSLPNGLKIKKTRFGEICLGLMHGAAYSFDEASYSRFYPLAISAGLPVEKADFRHAEAEGFEFFTVRISK